ncbi:unnamed protein product [Meganyctiphanes norvegica]|uniref:Uncharacterized protein n=1 Tax=Meganyctiphanes norvegica TaxID=48144 RepID=A0AAV2PSQ8_MEGNR
MAMKTLILAVVFSMAVGQENSVGMDDDERQFTVITTNNGLNLVALNLTSLLFGAAIVIPLLLLAALAVFKIGELVKGKESDDTGYYYEDNSGDSYMNYARRSLKVLSPVLEMLRKGYEKYE